MQDIKLLNNPLLSVIIPVYNCAPVVERCLDSIDYPEAEIIVVDDGSTDNTAHVVEEYQKRHNKVQLIRKKNGGPSSARNEGMRYAQGKYICFVDADDFLSKGGLERMLRIALDNDADIVKYKVNFVKNGSRIFIQDVSLKPINIKHFEGEGTALMSNEVSDYHVIDALFRNQLLKENNICFRTDLHLHEDDVFMCEVYCYATNVIGTSLCLYNYVVASDFSSTHTNNRKRVEELINSSIMAVRYRQDTIRQSFPDIQFQYERFKYMRYVVNAHITMVQGRFSYKQLKSKLQEFKALDVWPVEYRWIKIAGLKNKKLWVKTFLCNHPLLSYCFRFLYS